MIRRALYPLAAVATLGLAFSFNGCSCQAKMGADAQAKAPEAPPPEPVQDEAPPPAPAPDPLGKVSDTGKAHLDGDEVKVPGNIEFDVDKAHIRQTAQSKEILNTLLEFMKTNSSVTKLRIEGHTDDTGSSEHNHKLSQARAESIVKWLSDKGVEAGRLEAVGLGEERPVAPNDSAANKQKNRRTEFHVAEIEGKAITAAEAAAHKDAAATQTTGAEEKK